MVVTSVTISSKKGICNMTEKAIFIGGKLLRAVILLEKYNICCGINLNTSMAKYNAIFIFIFYLTQGSARVIFIRVTQGSILMIASFQHAFLQMLKCKRNK